MQHNYKNRKRRTNMTITFQPIDPAYYGVNTSKRIAIIEASESAIELSAIGRRYGADNLDSRLFTRILTLDSEGQALYDQDYLIIVHNYEAFVSDIPTAEAILAHELGHLGHGADLLATIEGQTQAELEADAHAVSQGYTVTLYNFIVNTRAQLKALADIPAGAFKIIDIRIAALEKVIKGEN